MRWLGERDSHDKHAPEQRGATITTFDVFNPRLARVSEQDKQPSEPR